MGRKTPEKKTTREGKEIIAEEREIKREESKDTKKEEEEEKKRGQHREGEADGVWHTPHAIIME